MVGFIFRRKAPLNIEECKCICPQGSLSFYDNQCMQLYQDMIGSADRWHSINIHNAIFVTSVLSRRTITDTFMTKFCKTWLSVLTGRTRRLLVIIEWMLCYTEVRSTVHRSGSTGTLVYCPPCRLVGRRHLTRPHRFPRHSLDLDRYVTMLQLERRSLPIQQRLLAFGTRL